jgi:hypothetical protein
MLLSKRSQFMLVLLVAVHGWASANESNKQPPLELPKALADGEPVAVVEKAKPDLVKKAAPKSEAVTSREVKAVTLPAARPRFISITAGYQTPSTQKSTLKFEI